MNIILEILTAMREIREELSPIEKERLKKCKLRRHNILKGESNESI